MASIEYRFSDNISGPFYVDSNCIACDTCVGIAPQCFRLTSDYDHAIVVGQPVSERDFNLCREALACCPVNAIGDDGSQ
ncbi:ferredoxin [bacterium]|nr:ferredoxin [bacterium]